MFLQYSDIFITQTAIMVKTVKKRSVNETKVVEKSTGTLSKVLKKKKPENGSLQNGQAKKEIKEVVSKKLVNEKKKDAEVVQNSNKKATNVVSAGKNKKKVSSKENKLELLKKRQDFREKRKENRKGKYGLGVDISIDELKQQIQKIESRGVLSKTAKRKLAGLKKRLRVEEGTDEPKQAAKKQTQKAKNVKSLEATKKKEVQSNEQKKKSQEKVEPKSNKENKRKGNKQSNMLLLKQKKEEEVEDEDDEDEDEEDVEMDNEVSEDEDESDVEAEEEEEDDEDDDDDDEEEEEEEEEEDDDDDENDDDDDDGESEEDKNSQQNEEHKVKESNIQSSKDKASPKNIEEEGKKEKHVLFVRNLPYTITNEELEKHFLTKVSQVVSIKIPKKDDNTPRGFAYVELANSTDHEKGLSLDNSFLNGRKINVQYANNNRRPSGNNNRFQGFQRGGRFSGGRGRNNHYVGNRGRPYTQRKF
ncbi:Polyadenylate-binding protein 2 [Anthophora plagiata]